MSEPIRQIFIEFSKKILIFSARILLQTSMKKKYKKSYFQTLRHKMNNKSCRPFTSEIRDYFPKYVNNFVESLDI